MSRLPVRVTVMLASVAAMAVVLIALALFLHARLSSGLDGELERLLDARAGDVAARIAAGDPAADLDRPDADDADEAQVAQVLTPDGTVLAASSGIPRTPILSSAALADAREDDVVVDRTTVTLVEEDGDRDTIAMRLLARPVSAGAGSAQDGDDDRPAAIVVVGAPLEDHDATLRTLDLALLVGIPVAILLAAVAGYGLGALALRPVERMRRRAAAIGATPNGERLPVPPASDEIGRLGTTLNEMLQRVDAAFARERTFAADASHELRTPLAVLRTEIELALRGDRDAAQLRAALESAHEEAQRLGRLAEDLLVLARADDGPARARHDPIEVRDLLEEVRDRFAASFAQRDRALDVEVDPAAGTTLHGDRLGLDQALGNLVANALAHGGGDTTLAAVAGDGVIELHVRDRGSRIPDELLERVFERFTSGGDGRRSGSGLGLAIAAALASAQGGTAHIRNRAGGGVDAWIRLSSSPHAAGSTVATTSPREQPQEDR